MKASPTLYFLAKVKGEKCESFACWFISQISMDLLFHSSTGLFYLRGSCKILRKLLYINSQTIVYRLGQF